MDAALRPEARRRDSGARQPQGDPGTGLPRGLRLASLPGARLEMAVQFQDPAIDTVNRR
jgi:hypothetical protein